MTPKSLIKPILYFIMGLAGVHIIRNSLNSFELVSIINSSEKSFGGRELEPVTTRDADGCYHVFIDAGANIGVHGRFLFEPDKYPDAKQARKLFDKEFGESRDNRDFCAFEFEPNPLHQETLEKKAEAYKAVGWRYYAMPFGVGDSEGNITFYHQGTDKDKQHEEWGFSMVKRSEAAIAQNVNIIHLSKWLNEHVKQRKIPLLPYGKNSSVNKPKVVMKLDVEGTEYSTFPDLISSGALCSTVDYVFGEFHPRRSGLSSRKEGVIQSGVQTILAESKNCMTKFVLIDDEAYLHDGVPLPTLNVTPI